MEEKFLLCDLKSYTKDNNIIYYINIYSSLTESIHKIFINKEDFEYLAKMRNSVNINDFLTRYYNTYKQTFAIRFARK